MNEVKSLEECRACLRKIDDGDQQELFQSWHTPWAIPGALIADDLAKLADVEISDSDKHSKVICLKCYHHLKDACSFLVTVQTSDCILRKRFENTTPESKETETSSWPRPILVNKNLNGNIENRLDVEIKQEVLSEDEYDYNQMDWEPTMDIKIEPEEFVAPVSSNIIVNGAYSLKERNEEAIHLNGTSNYCDEYLDNTIKEEPPSGDDHGVEPDLPLDCMLCMKPFNSVTGLKAHVIAQHSYGAVKRKTDNFPSPVKKEDTNEFVCATCRESFETRTDWMVHEAAHGKHVCFVCDAKFNTFRQLSRHGARCRPRPAPGAARARPPTRSQQLSQSNNNSSAVETREELVQKQSKMGPSIEESRVSPEHKLSKGRPSIAEVVPVQKQLKTEPSINEETEGDLVQKQAKLRPSTVEKKVGTVRKQSKIGPSIKETKETSDEKQSKIQPSIEDIKVELVQTESKTDFSIEETQHELLTKKRKVNGSTEGKKVETSSEKPHTIPMKLKNTKGQLKPPTLDPELISCNSLQYTILYEDESSDSDTKITKRIEETTSENNSATSPQRNQDNSDQIYMNTLCIEQVLTETNHQFTTHRIEFELHHEEYSDQENLLSDPLDDGNSHTPEESIPNPDEINQSMKVHLAINPLSEGQELENKMDIDFESVKSSVCEPNLVNISSEISENSVTH